ncbi:hypothetical protein [Micromonospora violae]|nr:hypothetical protein [Micromonospora violae]
MTVVPVMRHLQDWLATGSPGHRDEARQETPNLIALRSRTLVVVEEVAR